MPCGDGPNPTDKGWAGADNAAYRCAAFAEPPVEIREWGAVARRGLPGSHRAGTERARVGEGDEIALPYRYAAVVIRPRRGAAARQIGRASGRGRVCQ